jgi:hypothetical protein
MEAKLTELKVNPVHQKARGIRQRSHSVQSSSRVFMCSSGPHNLNPSFIPKDFEVGASLSRVSELRVHGGASSRKGTVIAGIGNASELMTHMGTCGRS